MQLPAGRAAAALSTTLLLFNLLKNMPTELQQSWDPSAGTSGAKKRLDLNTLANKQAMDLFHAAKAKILERALSGQESVRLPGSVLNRSVETP